MKYITFSFTILLIFGLASAQSPNIVVVPGGKSGNGSTTRYWDCCKPSCASPSIHNPPVATCLKDGVTIADTSLGSGCTGGTAYACNNQAPWVVNSTLAYGFAAASFTGQIETDFCCGCLLLTFTDQAIGQKMVVQITNSIIGDTPNAFDLALPGGGVGYYNQGCKTQWGAPDNGWGELYGGVNTVQECSQLPAVLQPGCRFRFEFFGRSFKP